MSFLAGFDEKKRKEDELEKHIEDKKNSNFLLKHHEAGFLCANLRLELNDLERLVKTGVLDEKLFDKIVADNKITNREIAEVVDNVKITKILDKIKEIEDTKDIDKILPKKFRITKNDFLEAKKNSKKKKMVLQKIDAGLDFLYYQSNQIDNDVAQLFTSFAFMADKKLVIVQENLIDIKDDLS